MTESCPVCLIGAELGRDRDYGERKQVNCPRCGSFEISRTALAMLDNRLSRDPLSRARLSHAIRLNTSEENRLFVGSTNLDELVEHPLPGIPQQLFYLAGWIAAQLGDDQLGSIPCPWPETLAGIVGAYDGKRVERLIDYAAKQGIVEHDKVADVIGLSPEGWHLIQPTIEKDEVGSIEMASIQAPSETIKAHCNVCNGDRNAFRRVFHSVSGDDGEVSWSDTYDVLECCGCNGISVRHTHWFSEWDNFETNQVSGEMQLVPGIKVTYWPPPTRRKKPEWFANLDDDVLRGVIDEVYQALNSGLIVLASIGTRTLLDRAMFLRVGDPRGGFATKLNKMVEKGHIGKDERGILEAITDAGSAAAHRAFVPTAKTLSTIIDTIENFLHREFILKTAVGEVRSATPSRPAAPIE